MNFFEAVCEILGNFGRTIEVPADLFSSLAGERVFCSFIGHKTAGRATHFIVVDGDQALLIALDSNPPLEEFVREFPLFPVVSHDRKKEVLARVIHEKYPGMPMKSFYGLEEKLLGIL